MKLFKDFKRDYLNLFWKAVSLLTALAVFFAFFPVGTYAFNEKKTVIGEAPVFSYSEQAESFLSVELSTGTVLGQLNPDDKFVSPPELVMLMTALLVLENVPDVNNEITVKMTNYPFVTDIGAIGIANGAKLTYRELLSFMLLCSGQDAASVMSIAISGRYSIFTDLMNFKASALGMSDTVYTNVNGVYDVEQTTSLKDIIKLISALYKNETFLSIINSQSFEVSPNAGKNLAKVYTSVYPQNDTVRVCSFGSYSENSLRLSVKAEEGAESLEVPQNASFGVFFSSNPDPIASVVRYAYGADASQMLSAAAENHKLFDDGYTVSGSYFIGSYLCDSLSFYYYDRAVKGYVREEDFSDYVFSKDFFDKINSESSVIPESFSLEYKDGYIYSDSRKPDDILTAADLVYNGQTIAVIPIYSSDIVVDEAPFGKNEDIPFFQKLLKEKNFYIATVAVILFAAVLCFVIYRKKADHIGEASNDMPSDEKEPLSSAENENVSEINGAYSDNTDVSETSDNTFQDNASVPEHNNTDTQTIVVPETETDNSSVDNSHKDTLSESSDSGVIPSGSDIHEETTLNSRNTGKKRKKKK